MATRDELLTAVETRLRQAAAGDLTPVLAPGAADEAGRLAVLLTEGDGDLHARYLLGMLYWHRSQGLPGGQDLSAAVTLLKPCFAVGIGSFPPALGTALAERAIPEALVAIQRAMSSADQDAVQGAADIWGRIRDAIPSGHPRYAPGTRPTWMPRSVLTKRRWTPQAARQSPRSRWQPRCASGSCSADRARISTSRSRSPRPPSVPPGPAPLHWRAPRRTSGSCCLTDSGRPGA
jgi:hypothetical protein